MHNDRLKWTWAWRLITTRVKRYVAGTLKNQKSFSAWNELETWGYKPGNVLDGTQDQSQYRRNLKKNKKMMDDLALMYNETWFEFEQLSYPDIYEKVCVKIIEPIPFAPPHVHLDPRLTNRKKSDILVLHKKYINPIIPWGVE